MTRFARFHRFQLAVVGTAGLAVAVLQIAFGEPRASLAGFAVLALLGLGPILFRDRGIVDERDRHHHEVSLRVANAAFWVVFVLVSTGLALRFDATGVPAHVLLWMVWGGLTLQIVVQGAVALTLDARGTKA